MKSFMKKVSVFLFATSIFAVGPAVYAQGEYDDMYFKKTDRQKVKFASDKREVKKDRVQAEPINPQEGLSARNVNPEYIARFNEENTQVDSDEDLEYFSEDYSNSDYYSTQNQSNQMNPYGYGMHGMHTMAMMDPFMMHSWGWRSRHYNPYMWGYDPFMDPWGMGMMGHYGMMSPYGMGMMGGWGMRPGFGMSMGYGWNSWNRGWYGGMGMGMGMGFGWGRPMGMWGHPMGMGMYNPYWGWGGGNVIIVNQWGEQGGRQVTRGSRSTGSSMIRQHTDSPMGSRAALASNNTRSGQATTNRSRNYNNAQNDYYNRSRTNVTNRTSADRSREAYSRPESRTSAVNRGSSLDPNRSSSQYRQRSNNMQNRSNYTPPARNRSTDFNRSAPPSRSGYTPQRSTAPRTFSNPSRGSSSPNRSFSSPSRGSSGGSFSAPSRGGSSGGTMRSGGGGSRGGGRGN
jgi:hypothetical protein